MADSNPSPLNLKRRPIWRRFFFHLSQACLRFVYPSFCNCCEDLSDTPLFCLDCWQLCAPLDPKERCSHCFSFLELYEPCQFCSSHPSFPIVQAAVFEPSYPTHKLCSEKEEHIEGLAGFLLYQWSQLDWKKPTILVPLPGMEKITKQLSIWLNVGYGPLLSYGPSGWHYKEGWVQTDILVLLIGFFPSKEDLLSIDSALKKASFRCVYSLNLMTEN